ncbi:MAG: alpha-L-fucosidase [Kiritimatiellia bacterium]|nr:alpha-L-fucosidase [Kiritimatiellia bacterium]
MMNRHTIAVVLALSLLVFAGLDGFAQADAGKKYEPNWESIDTRPLPEWFNEAKFGIFIVWGPYSVPSWVPKGYAEWYWKRSKNTKDGTHKFHLENYGEGFEYEQFAPMMKAELFDADFWADIVAKSGAKYVSFTVNYHDGFAMWPTKYAKTINTDDWNSVVTGPKRDVTAELKTALEKKNVTFGIYYSLMEWFHPLWVADKKEQFAVEWMHPKFKEVVTKYQPSFIFLDGEWHADYKTWHSEELAAWLYNESLVKDYVVVNDRWGKTRGKHGDIFESEYGGAKGWGDHPWQEDQGMGRSYGYNRNENATDYRSVKSLIGLLTSCAMNGGNLLLDIGPTGDGRIPVIMQDRLLEMGKWLKVNGEAIYGTTRHKTTSEGDVRYTVKGDDLYAICMKWPGDPLVLNTPKPAKGAEITMLGRDERIGWEMKGDALHIAVPQLTIDKLPCRHAWVLKIPGAAR